MSAVLRQKPRDRRASIWPALAGTALHPLALPRAAERLSGNITPDDAGVLA